MRRMFGAAVLALCVCVGPAHPSAQLVSYKEAPVRISHYQLNVASIVAQKKFWETRFRAFAAKIS